MPTPQSARSLSEAPPHTFLGNPTDGPRQPHGRRDQQRLAQLAANPASEFTVGLDTAELHSCEDDIDVGIADRESDRTTAART